MLVAVELFLVEQDPYNTGVVGFDCAGGGFIYVLGMFCVGTSPLVGLYRVVWCLWVQRLQQNLELHCDILCFPKQWTIFLTRIFVLFTCYVRVL